MSKIQVLIEESEFLSLSDAITTDNVDQLRYYPRRGENTISDTHRDLASAMLAKRGFHLVGHGWHISLTSHVDSGALPGKLAPTTYWMVIASP